MCSQFGHSSIAYHRDPVGNANRGKAVRDHNADAAFEVFFQLGKDGRFGFRIERRSGFIEYPDISTLIKLLLRFYDTDQGTVRVGGVDVKNMAPEELRSRIGVLFQDYATYELVNL